MNAPQTHSVNDELELGRKALSPALRARIRMLELRTKRLAFGDVGGAYRSSFRGSGIEFEEVRPYQPGDDVRTIDWKVTARTGEPQVKTYTEERQLRMHLVADTSPSMDFGSGEATKREVVAEAVALLAGAASLQRDLVGLDLFSVGRQRHVRPEAGRSQVLRVLGALMAEPSRPSTGRGLLETLEALERVLKRHGVLVVLSDFRGLDDAPWVDVAARLARRHDLLFVRVVDPFEEQLPDVGWLALDDPESGRRVDVDTSSAAVREAWAADARARRAAFAAATLAARGESVELSTAPSAAGGATDPLVSFFRARVARRGRGR
ncbi:hypothetical protein Pla163_25980 [Planctomycetes bacterium Pla163]|uniref:DUF58 domain-containing protein n=1 Tax=Rohdeia mirabilis TaxID=2528008 RepID=A0A518D1X0_9BACT|nr:hypothetical protein Pla163_25980 [Planctomycetes bacterium Pla163]